MARAAIEEGITTIVATPHHYNRHYDNYREDVMKYVSVLNEFLEAEQIPLNVLPGQEVRIFGDMLEAYHNGEILPVNNTKYLLIEFPTDSVPYYADRLLYDLQIAGITPVIVHPERNKELLENHEKMYKLVRNGVLTQVTAASVIGKFGKRIQQFTYQLMEAHLVHFIASDAHNTTSRPFHLRAAYEHTKNQFGVETYYMLHENSYLLVDNLNV